MSRGIDYGLGQTNIDKATGIRFGVIPIHALSDWAYESFEAEYPQNCPHCGGDVIDWDDEKHIAYKPNSKRGHSNDYACESCELSLGSDDVCGDEPAGHTLDDGEYKATMSGNGDSDIFILLSPYFTRAQFCSPCAPGACHLENPTEDGERAYAFGHDWFEGNKAPYPVYSVATGELIPTPEGKAV